MQWRPHSFTSEDTCDSLTDRWIDSKRIPEANQIQHVKEEDEIAH